MCHTFWPHDDNLHQVCFLAIAFLLLVRYMTLWTWPSTWSNPSTSFEYPMPLHSWVMSYGVSYGVSHSAGHHWQCVCSRCTCAVPRDLCVGANISDVFEIPDHDLSITLQVTCLYDQLKRVMRQNCAPPCVKGHTTICARARSRDLWIGVKNSYIFGIPNFTQPFTVRLLRVYSDD